MRIIFTFVLGMLFSFFTIALIDQIFTKFFLSVKRVYLHHNMLGLSLVITGLGVLFFGPDFVHFVNSTLFATFLIGSGFGLIVHHLLSESYLFSQKVETAFIKKHSDRVERILEILPGVLTWLALTSPIWLSFTFPFAVAYLILLADMYWLFTSFKIATLIYVGYKKLEEVKKIDWFKKLQDDFPDEWDNYYHILILPTYKEPMEVLEPAFDAIANAKYDRKKIFLAVGFEQWAPAELNESVMKKLEEYKKVLGGVFTTVHTLGEGEVKGPGTNRNFIVRNALDEFKKLNIPLDRVIATTLDADFVIHPQFIAGAMHKYLSTPADVRDKRSYTGVFLYNNNYWQAPTPMRVIATGTAFWQLSEMVGSDKYINFSSLSMNFKALVETGLWIPNKVNDDAGFFWKAYYHFDGDYKVLPHYLPISADTVLDVTLMKTIQNQYLQLKRWAYGVEHIPFIIKQYFNKKDVDFWDKTDKLSFILWAYFKWGTIALFITFGGLFIPLINPGYANSVVYYNLSVISSWVLTLAFLGLFSTVYVNEKLAPDRPKHWGIFQRAWSYIQWILVPIVLVSITTIPAIDAQTSLMLGRYLEFRVTNKARLTAAK